MNSKIHPPKRGISGIFIALRLALKGKMIISPFGGCQIIKILLFGTLRFCIIIFVIYFFR